MNTTITTRVEVLRQWMRKQGLDAFIIPDTDPHAGEYIPEHWHIRQWISGFNGSAGTAVVTLTTAALWTDSRYFLAATKQLDGTPFSLMKQGLPDTPSIAQWLITVLPLGGNIGMNTWSTSLNFYQELEEQLLKTPFTLVKTNDPFELIWKDRPSLPLNKVTLHSLEYAGASFQEKLKMLQDVMEENKVEAMVVSALDDVAWVLNMRGTDVPCNPVFTAYLYLSPIQNILYINEEKLTDEVIDYLTSNEIKIKDYKAIADDISIMKPNGLLLPSTINLGFSHLFESIDIVVKSSPVAHLKCVKNKKEIEGFRSAMLRDGVAMVKFLRWIKPAVAKGGESEISVANKLKEYRKEQALYCDDSFETISGYAEHGAIVHYEATPDTDKVLQPKGLLLLDSGGQYKDGTTDITRTIPLGTPNEEERHIYTLVLKGHLTLQQVHFPEGTSGTQLDALARYAMWQEGLNYGHGTGHGVGSYLNVHEGPQQIRMNYVPEPFRAGMTVTNEPGLYLPGKFGVRIENTMLAVLDKETEFGKFLRFEQLTLCPIDTSLIDFTLLTNMETKTLNAYHALVRERLMPLLDNDEDREWLEEATVPIC